MFIFEEDEPDQEGETPNYLRMINLFISNKLAFKEFGIKNIKQIQQIDPNEVEDLRRTVELYIFSKSQRDILNKTFEVFIDLFSKVTSIYFNKERLFEDEFQTSLVTSGLATYLYELPSWVRMTLSQAVTLARHRI